MAADRRTREYASGGFAAAADDLIDQLEEALAMFEEQAKQGTVRGAGTPAIEIVDASGGGAGAIGGVEMVLMVGLVVLAARGRRSIPRRWRP